MEKALSQQSREIFVLCIRSKEFSNWFHRAALDESGLLPSHPAHWANSRVLQRNFFVEKLENLCLIGH